MSCAPVRAIAFGPTPGRPDWWDVTFGCGHRCAVLLGPLSLDVLASCVFLCVTGHPCAPCRKVSRHAVRRPEYGRFMLDRFEVEGFGDGGQEVIATKATSRKKAVA